jgi:hypothetical protein
MWLICAPSCGRLASARRAAPFVFLNLQRMVGDPQGVLLVHGPLLLHSEDAPEIFSAGGNKDNKIVFFRLTNSYLFGNLSLYKIASKSAGLSGVFHFGRSASF